VKFYVYSAVDVKKVIPGTDAGRCLQTSEWNDRSFHKRNDTFLPAVVADNLQTYIIADTYRSIRP